MRDSSVHAGVRLQEDAPEEGPAATAMWLFDGSVKELPGGFDTGELSPNSPVSALKSFPQDLVLVGRSTVLIKGIAARLGELLDCTICCHTDQPGECRF